MSEQLSPELEAKAQDLAARIKARADGAILEMARRLVSTTDQTLFGDTEFALRDQALSLVTRAYAEHLPKKVATPPAPSTAPSAEPAPVSTDTATKRSKRSVGRWRAVARTTTARRAKGAPVPGTLASD
jgi:hypothetical protein